MTTHRERPARSRLPAPLWREQQPDGWAYDAWSGALFGVGIVGFVDETLFHQILQWHHFYDVASADIGLISDGVFHALSWFATVAGLFLFADLRRRRALIWRRWIGGILLGAGAFQLYDGIVQHKLWGIHQIRYVDDILPYDLVWNLSAFVMIVAGIGLLTVSVPPKIRMRSSA